MYTGNITCSEYCSVHAHLGESKTHLQRSSRFAGPVLDTTTVFSRRVHKNDRTSVRSGIVGLQSERGNPSFSRRNLLVYPNSLDTQASSTSRKKDFLESLLASNVCKRASPLPCDSRGPKKQVGIGFVYQACKHGKMLRQAAKVLKPHTLGKDYRIAIFSRAQ
jgi:hypothetical protein